MMTTNMRLLPVRTSRALRELIDHAGPVNAATRALLILGAAQAQLPLHGMQREIAVLLGEDLHPAVLAALQHVYRTMHDVAVPSVSATMPPVIGLTEEPSLRDPFESIGVEV